MTDATDSTGAVKTPDPNDEFIAAATAFLKTVDTNRAADALRTLATAITPASPGKLEAVNVETRFQALARALGMNSPPTPELVTARWRDGELVGIIRSDQDKSTEGAYTYATQGDKKDTGQVQGGKWAPKHFDESKPVDRFELRETSDGVPVAVGGPIPSVPTRCGE